MALLIPIGTGRGRGALSMQKYVPEDTNNVVFIGSRLYTRRSQIALDEYNIRGIRS